MSAPNLRAVVSIAATLLGISALAEAQVLPPPGPESLPGGPGLVAQDGDDSHDVLTRGPIHEAFAEQYNADPDGGMIVVKAPPEPIDEIAPETIPEGNNMQWMSGYWGWDDERQDFIWISGLWRDIPPGQRWVPGYWNPVEGGFQWVSGFWTGTENAELDYQYEGPPATLEQGPNIEAPAENQFWVPGVWTYVDTGYRWRPGYWAPAYDDWVWVPDRWVWTPYGFVFCPGYHDYRLPVRAVAFAPVYFTHVHWWHHHHRPFCPSVVLDSGPLTMHWFVRPNYGHYYFGDYYADTYYTGWGLQPWYTCSFGFGGYAGWRHRHCHYDPLFTFYSGYHRRHHHVDFGDRMHRWHNHYVAHADDRPRWTKRDQDNFDDAMRKAGRVRGDGKQNRIGRDFNDFVKNPTERDQKFVRLDERQRERQTKIGKENVQLATLRHDIESDGGKIRGVRGDGKKDGNKRDVGLPGLNGGDGNSGGNNNGNGGNGGRGSRKVKLPTDQGAGDQAVVTQDGNREPNRKKGRIKPPDGPPGGNNGLVGNDGNGGGNNGGNNKSGGNNSRRGRGPELTDGTTGQNGNNTPVTDGNSNKGRDNNGRGNRGNSKGGSNGDPASVVGGNVQLPGNDGGNNKNNNNIDSSRGRSRNKGNDGGNQGLNPLQGNPSGGGNSSSDGNKGSNRDRSPRRGNSSDGSNGGNNGGLGGGGDPNFRNQPPSGGGNKGNNGNNNNNNGNNSNGGRSRSRGSLDSNSGGNGGNNGFNNGNSGGNNNQRRNGDNKNNKGSGSGVGNPSGGSGGSLGSGGGGGGSRRNNGNNGGNNGGKKKKD